MAAPADAQRERAVAVLKRAYADGRLELEELEDRAAKALAARTGWQLRYELRGLLADDVKQRAARAARVAATVTLWLFLSAFLLVGGIVTLIFTHASPWTLLFPAAWIVVTLLARRELRRPG